MKQVKVNFLKFLEESASAGAGAISKKSRCVRKCVRNNFLGAEVCAPHTKMHRNPTSAYNGMSVNKHFLRQNIATSPHSNSSSDSGNFNRFFPPTHDFKQFLRIKKKSFNRVQIHRHVVEYK